MISLCWNTVGIAFRGAGDERHRAQISDGEPELVQGSHVIRRLRRHAMGQRPEPDAGRRPASDPGRLRAANAQQGDTPGRPGGAFGADRRGPRVRQTHAGQCRVRRVGSHAVRPDVGQYCRQVSRQVRADHVAPPRQQSREVSGYSDRYTFYFYVQYSYRRKTGFNT